MDIINKYLDCDKIKEKNKVCYAACTKLPNYTVKYFRINDYDNETGRRMILASASLPLIYDSTEVFGEKYIDGGIVDNTPIQPVYGENCDVIIVVLLSEETIIDRSLYQNSKLIIIALENLSENTITGTLNLDAEAKARRIIEGYNDTMNKLEPVIDLFKFIKEENDQKENPVLYKLYNWLKDFINKIKNK